MIKELFFVGVASLIVAGLFLGYMFSIGIPKTQARNFYNAALEELVQDNRDKAIEYLQKAKTSWNEVYIEEKIAEIETR